ncbi:MAG: hypothetical protein JO027_12590 [Solirubrobacterales bacterium]|nr:hypothetical protein [Solirubrobacterales bacterium]
MSDDFLPEPPNDPPKEAVPTLTEARYQKQLDIAQTEHVVRADTALALQNARADTQRAVDVARENAALALQNTRADTRQAVLEARVNADRAAEVALLKSIHDAYITVAQGTMDRTVTRAQFLTAAIGAVATTYTTLLGVNYAVASHHPAPGRALIPVIFLGLAFVLASVYVAYLSPTSGRRNLLPTSIGGTVAEDRLRTFMEWTFASALARAWAIRGAVVAFGIAIALLPLPFLSLSSNGEVTIVVLVGGVPAVAWVLAELYVSRTRG